MSVIGHKLDSLDTPALWVDLDQMEKNILYFSNYFKTANLTWRPHIKGVKIPAIAHKMIDAGAIGVTCAKVSEAEVMVAGGIKDILIANQVVGESKVSRLAYLNRQADVMVAVDDLENAKEISRIAKELGVKIRVLVEMNSGMNRCGLPPGRQTVEFSSKVADLPGIVLTGLMSWEGHVVKIEDPKQKKLETEKAVGSLVETAELCRKSGIPISIVSCGGTGSYMITSRISGVTEIEAGGGIFGDVTYQRWGAQTAPSLFILATVSSHPSADRAIIDAGRKAMNVEYSMPTVKDLPGVELVRCSAEHGILKLDVSLANLKVGDRINLVVGYEDLTVFLHDQLVGIRAGKVEAVWDIQGTREVGVGKGCLQRSLKNHPKEYEMLEATIKKGNKSQKVSLRQKLYDQIKQEIIHGTLAPTQPLSESELSERYEVSSTPVREALTSLHRDKLVDYSPNRGFMVSPISVRDVQEIYEARVFFESALLRLAINRITEEEIQELERTQEISYDVNDPESVDNYFHANFVFHMTIAAASRNSRLISHYHSLLDEAQRLIYIDMQNTNVMPIWHKSHQELIDAIKNKDEAACIKTLEEIMENGKRRILGGNQ